MSPFFKEKWYKTYTVTLTYGRRDKCLKAKTRARVGMARRMSSRSPAT